MIYQDGMQVGIPRSAEQRNGYSAVSVLSGSISHLSGLNGLEEQ